MMCLRSRRRPRVLRYQSTRYQENGIFTNFGHVVNLTIDPTIKKPISRVTTVKIG